MTDTTTHPEERKPALENKHGRIPVGTTVYFDVENSTQWIGPTRGVLEFDGSEFVIRTNEGIVTINKGYDAYLNTICPIGPSKGQP